MDVAERGIACETANTFESRGAALVGVYYLIITVKGRMHIWISPGGHPLLFLTPGLVGDQRYSPSCGLF